MGKMYRASTAVFYFIDRPIDKILIMPSVLNNAIMNGKNYSHPKQPFKRFVSNAVPYLNDSSLKALANFVLMLAQQNGVGKTYAAKIVLATSTVERRFEYS
jgi:hypothetical protein